MRWVWASVFSVWRASSSASTKNRREVPGTPLLGCRRRVGLFHVCGISGFFSCCLVSFSSFLLCWISPTCFCFSVDYRGSSWQRSGRIRGAKRIGSRWPSVLPRTISTKIMAPRVWGDCRDIPREKCLGIPREMNPCALLRFALLQVSNQGAVGSEVSSLMNPTPHLPPPPCRGFPTPPDIFPLVLAPPLSASVNIHHVWMAPFPTVGKVR